MRLENVSLVYPDKKQALTNISFSIREGESVAVMGGNGAGKTSLLHTMAGVLEPACGELYIDERKIDKSSSYLLRRSVGLVFQNPDDQLFMPLIYDDVAFGLRNMGLGEDEVAHRVEATLEMLNISALGGRSPLRLSGGEKRMAAIATVLVMTPLIVAFDEPTAFLDPRAKRSFIDAVLGIESAKLIATHDIELALDLCSRVIFLNEGQITAQGGTELLKDKEILSRCGLI